MKVFASFLMLAVFTFVALVVQISAVMLVVGALHSHAPVIPSLSFSASGFLVFLAYLLVWPATATLRSK